MPAPIAPPPGDYSAATKHYSPTSSIHFPTHLTVTTTSASRATGDWGFKRPLPVKTTTNTTYPLVRVRKVDSTEHVTDFQSASDHAITLKKFQELSIPLSVPIPKSSESYVQRIFPSSVFEEDTDVTALTPEQKSQLANVRWKFTGPWLAGMTDGEFKRYLVKKVRCKRAEFRAVMKQTLAAEMTKDRAQKAREAAETTEEPPAVTADDIDDALLTDYLRDLRQDRMTLFNLVSSFLDLAPVDQHTELSYLGTMAPNRPKVLERSNPYAAEGPPITHPSAGLSYLRTRMFQENHPIYGPQKHHPPIKSRVLRPANTTAGIYRPSIGVGGFVGSISGGDNMFNETRQSNTARSRSLRNVELEKYGGSKIYTHLNFATVSSSGRTTISITDNQGQTEMQAEIVQKELVGEGTVFEEELRMRNSPPIPRNPMANQNTYSARPGSRIPGNASSYGLGNIFSDRRY